MPDLITSQLANPTPEVVILNGMKDLGGDTFRTEVLRQRTNLPAYRPCF